MAGDAAMQPAGSAETLSDLAGFIESQDTEEELPGVEGEEEQEASQEGQDGEG